MVRVKEEFVEGTMHLLSLVIIEAGRKSFKKQIVGLQNSSLLLMMPLPLLPLILAAKRYVYRVTLMYATQRSILRLTSIMKILFCGSDNNASGWREVSRDTQIRESCRQDHPRDIWHNKFISKSKNLYLKMMILISETHREDVIKLIVPYKELSLRIRPAR